MSLELAIRLPEFNLNDADWEEINCALDNEELIAKEVSQVTDTEWVEIYLSVQSKLEALRTGFYGRDRLVKDWIEHIKAILSELDPIRAKFIGGRAPRFVN